MDNNLVKAHQEQKIRMSYEEFLDWADEDQHAEWVAGEVTIFMPTKPRHQLIVTFLSALLEFYVRFFRLGQILTAPVEMKASPTSNAREPDILFVAHENQARITEERLDGPADLIVEVISKESVTRDRADKYYEYEEGGVKEYWLVDSQRGKERAEFWVLGQDGKYQPVPLDKTGSYRSKVIPGFWLRAEWLWAEERPDPLLTFAEITGFPAPIIETLHALAARGPQERADE